MNYTVKNEVCISTPYKGYYAYTIGGVVLN